MDEPLFRPFFLGRGVLFGLKAGTSSTAQALEVSDGAARVGQAGNYEIIAVSQTALVPGGGVGAVGDLLSAIIVTANTGTITVLDGAVTVLVIPAALAVGSRIEINALAKTKWNITTPAATTCVCVGKFS